jgi:hypothetical protein
VHGRDRAHDGQAEEAAVRRPRRVGPAEAVESVVEVRVGKAVAAVAHVHLDLPSRRWAESSTGGRPWRKRVVDEVVERLVAAAADPRR